VVNAPDLDAEKNPATRLLRARVYLAAKRTDQANTDVAAAYGLIDSADPTKAQAFTAALRGTFETIKEYEQALKRLESRKAFGPWLKLWTSAALLNDDSTREAGAAPIRALGERAEDSRVKIAAWRVLAASAYGRKQFEEAERYFREVLKLEPGDPEANNNLAYMLGTDLKRPADGLPFAEKALVSAPDSSPLLDTLGTLHMQLNQMDQARVMLAKALEKARSEAEQFPALVHMAQAELAVGNKDEALRYFMAAAQYQMTNPQAGSAYIEDLKALQAALKP
jgi:tetratricopeptide (TPR) repeat protein